MKFSIGLLVAGALLIAAASVVLSQGPRGGVFRGGHERGDGLGSFGRDLNLTDDQKAQIKKIQDGFRATE